MAEDINFFSWLVPDLKNYLQERGIQCSLARKLDLVRLCELAHELNLEILTADSHGEYVDFDTRHRSVNIGSEVVILDQVSQVSNWNKDLSQIPDVESFDVLVYLTQKCGWNSARLSNYKQDNGYRLHMAGHIDDVQASSDLIPGYMYVKCKCVPETRQSAQPYESWILIRMQSGEIVSGGCTCVADNGACKHCVAFIFSLSSFCERHRDRSTEACTDIQCVWDKPRKKSVPSEISNIDLRIDQSQQPSIVPTLCNYDPRVPAQEIPSHEKDFYNLCKGTDALVLQTLYSEEFDSEDDSETVLPSMTDAFKDINSVDIDSVTNKLKDIFNSRVISEIEEVTVGQNQNFEWFEHRKGRITASLFSSVKCFRFTDNTENYISKQIMGKTTNRCSPSMSFGSLNEPVARHQYFEQYKQSHKHAEIRLCGLFIDPDAPYLGASPDGIVKCKCCGEGLLEVKCSFVHQNKTPREACLDDHYHVRLDENENVQLKIDSPWYIQIQGQLGVCKKQWCDFVFFTKKGFIVDRIYFDEVFFKSIFKKANNFFMKYIVPALKTD
ncbi:uncharacterized protein LOC134239315 [Saccostrea cucullata]|uniref:uncharacterized protein LOC134239315 n=1 Tax=Saccostrea cuccullata TaxID=36930 RepID=UPI002ED307FC